MKNNFSRLLLLSFSILSLTLLTSCGGGGGGSTNTPGTTPPPTSDPPVSSEWVQNVKASIMKYTDKIELNWSLRPEENVTYIIYRYDSKASNAPENVFTVTTNKYIDTSPTMNIPYYYRVTWVKDTVEYGKDAPLVVGIYHSEIDISEPNDVLAQADSLISGMSLDVYTFVFDDGVGGSTVDTDWYCCKNTSEDTSMVITINLPGSTGLTIKCFHDGIEEILNDGIITLNIMPNDTKYFCIEPTDGEGFGAYRITVQ